MKKNLFLALIISYLLISCGRVVTPYQAATKGKMRCGKDRLK